MKITIKNNELLIQTNVYQAKNGAIYINWSNTVIKLNKEDASIVAYDIPGFDIDSFNNYYNKQ